MFFPAKPSYTEGFVSSNTIVSMSLEGCVVLTQKSKPLSSVILTPNRIFSTLPLESNKPFLNFSQDL